MRESFTPWDSAQYLKTEEDRIDYLQACIAEAGEDPAFMAKALATIARAVAAAEGCAGPDTH
ncbi:helix-turn-helix domain-containing transcriptional regulator [Pseudomonas sp. TE3610]